MVGRTPSALRSESDDPTANMSDGVQFCRRSPRSLSETLLPAGNDADTIGLSPRTEGHR